MLANFLETDIGPVLRESSQQLRQNFRELLRGKAREVEKDRLRPLVPVTTGLFERQDGMHYHFKPEVFIQLQGFTQFRFPNGSLLLRPGQMAILPTGLPHAETVWSEEEPFRNAVIGFYSATVSMHYAYEARPKHPDIEAIEFYATPNLRRIVDLLDFTVEAAQTADASKELTIKGLSLAFLSVLAGVLEAPGPGDAETDSLRIFQVKWLVREQLYNPNLCVKYLAQRLGYSADYLSHYFHKETGEMLIHYINRQRIQGAVTALSHTTLSVSEIGWSCGYSSPGYFTRVFRRFMGVTPQEFRRQAEESKRTADQGPKTVYHDREDYTAGLPRQGTETDDLSADADDLPRRGSAALGMDDAEEGESVASSEPAPRRRGRPRASTVAGRN